MRMESLFHFRQVEKKFISELYGTSEETIVAVKSCIYFEEYFIIDLKK